jgi:hypothetical protein
MCRRTLVTVVAATALVALLALLGGCGSSGSRTPALSQLPLVPGARVVEQQTDCNPGAHAYCALELVIVDPRYVTSADLVDSQHDLLLSKGWSGATGDTGGEHAADSPGHKLRVTYATPDTDLRAWAFTFIKRTKATALALSHAMFARQSAMSVLLEVGSG